MKCLSFYERTRRTQTHTGTGVYPCPVQEREVVVLEEAEAVARTAIATEADMGFADLHQSLSVPRTRTPPQVHSCMLNGEGIETCL